MYCTYTDILALSGTALPQATIEALIVMADREVDSYCSMHGVSASGSNAAIVSASINLSMGYLLTRYRMDGTKEASTLEWSDKTPIDTAIETYRKSAFSSLDTFISQQTSGGFIAGIVNK